MMTKNTNIDEKCAEYGFRICDYAKEIYDALNRELKRLQERNSVNLVEAAKEVYERVINSLSQDVEEYQKYVKINELEKLIKLAEALQKSEITNEEKIGRFSKERKFSNFAQECENSLRKVLGILSTDGVFASIIWIESNKDKEDYRAIKYQMSKFLQEIFKSNNKFSGNPENLREEILKVCSDISQMFFVKQILEQMLTYALYRARSLR